MSLRIGFYAALAIAISVVTAGCTLTTLWLFVYLEPLFTTAVMVLFGMGFVGVTIGVLARYLVAGKNPESRKTAIGCAFAMLLPLAVFLTGIGLIFGYSLPEWSLPRSAASDIQAVPTGDYATFLVDGQMYAYDFDQSKLLNWRTTPTTDHNAIVGEGDFIHYGRMIVGRNGKEYKMTFKKDHYSSGVFLTPDAQQVYYEVQYRKEENGLWRGPVADAESAEKYAPFGRDVFWPSDASHTWFCTGEGLHKYDREGEGELVVKAEQGYSVIEPVLSPDEGQIAFVLKHSDRQGVSKLCTTTLTGDVTELYTAEPGAELSLPQWSNDQKSIAFRYKTRGNSTDPVTTIAKTVVATKETRTLAHFPTGVLLTPRGVVDFAWSPDDSQIVFLASLKGATYLVNEGGTTNHKFDLYLINADGSELRRLTKISQNWAGSVSGVPLVWWSNE